MTIKNTLITSLLFASSFSSMADGIYDDVFNTGWTKVITLSGGPAWTQSGETQTLYLAPGLSNTYVNNKTTHTMGYGELFFALQRPFNDCILEQWGIGIAGTSEVKLSGHINTNFVPSGSNYEYRINQGRVVFRGKFIADPKRYVIQPYLTASLGVSFNRSYGFQTRPLVNPVFSPRWFDPSTNVAFTYSGGLGLQVALNDHWQAGVGYEFADWGKSQLGRALNPWSIDGLHLTHVYAHQAVFSISYLC